MLRREPLPGARHWSGRRLLAVLDAITWPIAVWLLVVRLPASAGVIAPVVGGLLAWSSVRGANRALFHNERYRFITWRVAGYVAPLVAIGLALKLYVFLGS